MITYTLTQVLSIGGFGREAIYTLPQESMQFGNVQLTFGCSLAKTPISEQCFNIPNLNIMYSILL